MARRSAHRPLTFKAWSRVRVATFLVALVVPLAIMVSPSLRTWAGARPALVPDWSWRIGDIRRYPARFQEQFDAALPFRLDVASFSRSVYVDWLGRSPVPEVVLGTDGWLYYTGPANEHLLDRHVRGSAPFSPEELDLWRERLIERTQRFRSIGARYAFVIAPNKESIYPEHLPTWVGSNVGPTRLDQLMAHLKSVPEVTVIDLRRSLIAEKKVAALYYKTDTHWTARGAYVAYREVMRVLATGFPALAAKSWESFEPAPVERQGMDLARMIGLVGAAPEADFELRRSPCTERHAIPVPIPEALQSKLTAPAYGTRCDAPGNVDAVIFHDSFGVALDPFLAASFRSSANFSATAGSNEVAGYDVPERLKANLVVEIMVERGLIAGPNF
jgi:alginate O-acetyltransferase complex protein AlgJ